MLIRLCCILVVLGWLPALHAEQREIIIPALLGLSGDSAQFGRGELDGVTLAAEKQNARGGINGARIRLEVEDTATSQMQVLSAFRKLTDISKHRFILGPTWLDTFQGVLPLAEKKKVLLLTPSAEAASLHHGDPSTIMAISTYYSSKKEVDALMRALQHDGVRTLIGTYTEEPFFQFMRGLAEESARELGMRFLGAENFDFGHTDFNTFMTKARKQAPDALLLFQTEEGAVASFLRARRLYFPQVIAAGCHDFVGFLRKPALRALAGRFYFTYFELADPGFSAEFEQRFGYQPILTHANAYDAANILFAALAAGKRSGTEIRDHLLSHRFKTVTFGETGFTPAGGIAQGNFLVSKLPAEH